MSTGQRNRSRDGPAGPVQLDLEITKEITHEVDIPYA
jgi:hypothetical protein